MAKKSCFVTLGEQPEQHEQAEDRRDDEAVAEDLRAAEDHVVGREIVPDELVPEALLQDLEDDVDGHVAHRQADHDVLGGLVEGVVLVEEREDGDREPRGDELAEGGEELRAAGPGVDGADRRDRDHRKEDDSDGEPGISAHRVAPFFLAVRK
ncbi:MAG: hypothetical protein MUE73_14320 [Planctomycetes bacterium]|nr:hypothetical protein [Planctomycetota bacterium]